jgi:hypothetical protein
MRCSSDREVAENEVGELGDREDVDEVEEELDGGGPLRPRLAARAEVAER